MSRAETRIISDYLRVSYPGILQSIHEDMEWLKRADNLIDQGLLKIRGRTIYGAPYKQRITYFSGFGVVYQIMKKF